jgi:hypothetical protein
MLGNWAAAQLGLKGEAGSDYAKELFTADLENQIIDATLHRVSKEHRVSKDLAKKGISEQQVAHRMNAFLHIALEQIEAGN